MESRDDFWNGAECYICYGGPTGYKIKRMRWYHRVWWRLTGVFRKRQSRKITGYDPKTYTITVLKKWEEGCGR